MANKFSIFFFCFILVSSLCIEVSVAKKNVGYYEIKKGDFSVTVTNYGATILSVMAPDNKGNVADIALGFKSIGRYTNDTIYFGALVGRVANRISGGRFYLNGDLYKTFLNEPKATLHGGHRGFGDVFWTVKKHQKEGRYPHITLTYDSFDGEQGFPGDLSVSVTYMLMEHNKLSVTMKAKALNKATPVNLAQHTYWNLGGHNSGDILSNHVQIYGSHITPVDGDLLPTGEITPVKGTPYDFLRPHKVGSRINKLSAGYDINYVLDGPSHMAIRKAAKVHDSKSGRILELWTNKPGLQFYTGNMLKDVIGKDGAVYQAHAGLCLETQGFPDSVNHPNFPSQIVNPGETYEHIMLYKFSTN